MGPRELQQKIHSTFSTGEVVWDGFRSEIVDLYELASGYADFNDHLIREFNRKVYKIGHTGLAFTPHDGGYRFIGSEVATYPDEGYVFLFIDNGDQVFTFNNRAIQVPSGLAN